jgi:hypothetical protein
MKYLIVLGIISLLLIGSFFFYNFKNQKEESMEQKVFQGPVPEGYDEEHFRLTGETKPSEVKE